jgi:IS5 family transposase
MVFLQGLYNLSDEQCEHQVLDRLSFQRFCRLEGALNIPDARTLWSFRQRLAAGGLGGRAIFESLSQQLQRHGFIPRGGQIVDASIVQAPITQTNTREREALNKGQAPEGWSNKRLAHTDRDARWTHKHGKSYYGYKLHSNVDARYKLIRQMKVTAANADDGQQLPDVLQVANTRKRLLADRGYDSAANRQTLQRHGLADGIARRAKPGQTAKVRLKQRNKTINRTRARVEHVFAALSQQGGKCVRAMTLARNALAITLQCAAYNARRLVWLVKSAGASARPA